MSALYQQWSTRIAHRYGRKVGWLKYYWFILLLRLGAYRAYKKIEWDRVMRVVFVCRGNICRSPYGEARARALGLKACSRGLDTNGDRPAHRTAIDVAYRLGVDLSRFRSTAFDAKSIMRSDLLVAMEPYQAKRLKDMCGSTQPQITLLGLWHPRSRPFVQDPYNACPEYFETCFTILDESVRRIATLVAAPHER
jgi:protein-tyrosine phosphatase